MKKQFISIILIIIIAQVSVFAQKKTKKPEQTMSNTTSLFIATPASERLAGYEQRKKLTESSLVNNLKFRNIGPTVMSGRVVDIDANPENPAEFYVAYASGGLWKTVNNGQSFEPLFDNEAVMTIGDIAIDWKNNIIWIGTGENNSSRSSYSGVGMYKSTDGGKTWKHLGLEESHHVGRIVLHPTNPDIAWVGVIGHLYSANKERGVYKTTDGGKTWKQTLYLNDVTGAIDLKADPNNADVLYAAMWHRERKAWRFVESGNESGIYKSVDGGESWKLISDESSGFPQGKGNGRIGLAVYPQNTNIVYAIVDNQAKRPKEEKTEEGNKLTKARLKNISKEDFLALNDTTINEYLDEEDFPEKFTAKQLKEDVKANEINVKDIFLYTHNDNDDLFDIQIVGADVYRSDDAGKTWKRTNTKFLDDIYYTYGYYFGQIWVAPNNADKVVIVGVPIVKSEDGGKTFESIDNDNVHGDHHALWFNPKNTNHYILGNDGGINITYDNGKTWFKANTPAVGQFYAVAVDMAKPYNVYGGLQDNGVWTGTSTYKHDYGWYDSGEYPYKFLLGGDGMQVQVDWRDNNTVYTGFQFGNYFRVNKATGEKKYLQVPREMGEEQLRFNWEAPFLLSRHNQDIAYFGSHKFHRSLDKGDSWKTLSGDLTRGKKEGNVPFGTLTTIEESPLKFGLLYTGSDDGLVQISKDGGYTWEKIMDNGNSNATNSTSNLWVSGISASKHQEGTVYLSLNAYREDHFKSYLFTSTDYGKNWLKIGSSLPAEPINVVKEDPVNQNILYVGTDHGLYISLDKGTTFMRANGNMPAVAIHDLLIHPRENELLVGTHGRSLYLADVKPLQALNNDILAKDIYLYDLNAITYNANWGKTFNKYAKPKVYEYPIRYYSKTADSASIKILTTTDVLLRTIHDNAEAGYNSVNFDYSIDDKQKEYYEKYLNTDKTGAKKIELKAADDKKIYLHAGKYKIVIQIGKNTIEKELEIKEAKKQIRKNISPEALSSPDSFEEWFEEMGFENIEK